MTWKRRLLRLLAMLLALLAMAVGAALLLAWREYRREPLPLIDAGPVALRMTEQRSYPVRTASGEERNYRDLTFEGAWEGPLRITLSVPDGRPEPLPVLVILGGLEVGRESLKYVEVHGRNVLVAIQYPRSPSYWYEGLPITKLAQIRAAVVAIPSRTASVLAWLRTQPWADPDRINLLGYSFGAIFVPASARLAGIHGIPLRSLVMAYAGTGVPELLATNAKLRPVLLRKPAAWLAGAMIRPIEPALHLPHLRQEALFVNGLRDEMVPLHLARRMQALHGGRRTVIELDALHMDPKRPELTREIVHRSWDWLIRTGAANP
jgi:hypothetical protein